VREEISNVIDEASSDFNPKIVPVMREAIVMVQMILYRRLKEDVQKRYQDWSDKEKQWLAGAVVNNIFGTEAADPEVNVFARKHRELIEQELRELKERIADLIPHLTDALRMQTICDNHEGVHSIPCLLLAKELGLFDQDRVLPMPSTFMIAVRKLATDHGLVEEMDSTVPLVNPQE
jgi:hypothetical protein